MKTFCYLSVFHVPLPVFGELSYCVWCTRRYLAAAQGGEFTARCGGGRDGHPRRAVWGR
jgi:hypothetical protein